MNKTVRKLISLGLVCTVTSAAAMISYHAVNQEIPALITADAAETGSTDYSIKWASESEDDQRTGTYVDKEGNTKEIVFKKWESTDSLPTSAGTYYLSNDVHFTKTEYSGYDPDNSGEWVVNGEVTLCLNGHSISSGSVITYQDQNENLVDIVLNTNSNLNLFDTKDGVITHDENCYNSGIHINGGTLNMYGGSIRGNVSNHNPAGVYIQKGTFNMYGGSIEDNQCNYLYDSYCGVVAEYETVFNMYGGTIKNNINSNNKNANVFVKGTFNQTGGTVDKGLEYDWNYYAEITFESNKGQGTMEKQYVSKGEETKLNKNEFTNGKRSFEGWNTYEDGTGSGYDDEGLINLEYDTTLYAQWSVVLDGDGSEESPFEITSQKDWNYVADLVNNGESFSGKYFKLTDDIYVTKMIGEINEDDSSTEESKITYPFSGVFDGNGHSIYVNIDNDSISAVSVFRGTKDAAISNLKVSGFVNGGKYSSGLVGYSSGSLEIDNVDVSVEVSGSTHHGGFIGNGQSSDISFNGCAYRGRLIGTTALGGFVGWSESGVVCNMNDCLFCGTHDGGGQFNPFGYVNESGTATITDSYTTLEKNGSENEMTCTGEMQLLHITAPTARKNLRTTGDKVVLVNEGSVSPAGTIEYSVDNNEYSEELPTGIKYGYYSVQYRVKVGSNYTDDLDVLFVEITYDSNSPSYTVIVPENINVGDGKFYKVQVNYIDPDATEKIRVSIIGNDGAFKVTQDDDELTYTISGKYYDPDVSGLTSVEVKDLDDIISVNGAYDLGNTDYMELKFNEPEKKPKYSGNYVGTVTFDVRIDE